MKNLSLISALIISVFFLSCKKGNQKDNQEDSKAILPDFSWSGTQIAPAEITFNNLTQNGATYRWDFNNGTSSTLENPGKVRFVNPGAYTVSLTASKGENRVFTSKVILIAENESPVASFSYAFKNKISYAPATVQFTNESVNASGYEWDINGRKDNSQTPTDVTFGQPGNYSVKLIAVKGANKSVVFEEIITVAANPNPVAKFQVGRIGNGIGFFVGQEIILVNQSTNSDSYTWNLGNNLPKTSNEESPIVKLTSTGVNTFTLTAKKGTLTDTKSINITVQP